MAFCISFFGAGRSDARMLLQVEGLTDLILKLEYFKVVRILGQYIQLVNVFV
jgi:hypothetical protein